MNYGKRIALTACTAAAMAMSLAMPAAAGTITIEKAWAESEENGADIYLIIQNTGESKDVLYAVKTKIAKHAKLEALSEAEDRAGKNKTVLKFDIEPGQRLELTEEGPHIELRGLRRELEEGDSFQVTFYFENAGPIFTDVVVEDD